MNPWQTPAGLNAQRVRFTLLARGSGEVAEFAREVLAGRVKSRDLLYSSILSDQALEPARASIEQWHRLSPEERERITAEAADHTEERIAALNAVEEPTPRPTARRVEDDDEDDRPLMTDAW